MMVGSISRRNTKPPGKVCARAGAIAAEAEAAIANAVTIVFTNPHPQWGWPDLFRPSPPFLRLIPKKTWMAATSAAWREKIRSGDNMRAPYSPLPRRASLPIALVLMTPPSKSTFVLGHRHLLGIEGLSADDITGLLDLSEEYVELNRQVDKKRASLRGRTQINLFFEASTRKIG